MSDQDNLREEVRQLKEQLSRIAEQLEKDEPVEPGVEEIPVKEPFEEEPEPEEISDEEDPTDFEREERRSRRNGRYGKLYGEMYGRAWRPNEAWGEKLGDYIGDFVNEVMDSVSSELDHTIFFDGKTKRERPTMMSDKEVKRTAAIMSAMGNEHRVTILKELSWGGMYSSDLQESVKDIGPSTLSSHLDVLDQVGWDDGQVMGVEISLIFY